MRLQPGEQSALYPRPLLNRKSISAVAASAVAEPYVALLAADVPKRARRDAGAAARASAGFDGPMMPCHRDTASSPTSSSATSESADNCAASARRSGHKAAVAVAVAEAVSAS
jgi:hypothetical protein